MVNQEVVEEVKLLSNKGKSTDIIRNLLSRKYERRDVDDAVQYYIDNFIVKEVKSSKEEARREQPAKKNKFVLFIIDILLFRGPLPPMILFAILLYFSSIYFVSKLFPFASQPVILYFFLFFAYIIYLMQSGVIFFLIGIFRGSDNLVDNSYSKALVFNIFIMFIGAVTLSFFMFSHTRVNMFFLVIAPVLYMFMISYTYNISVVKTFFAAVILALINDLLIVLLLFSTGYIFLGKNVIGL